MRPRTRFATAALLGVTLVTVGPTGCGKKGPPRPPQWVVPGSPAPVRAEPQDGGIEISWPRPRTYVDGQPMDDLDRFIVSRACEGGLAVVLIDEIVVTDRDRFRKQRRFKTLDSSAPQGATCRYRVVARTTDEYESQPTESAPVLIGTSEPSPAP